MAQEEVDLSKMSAEEKRDYLRKRVVKEIISTEEDYVNDLEVVINVHIVSDQT